MIVCDTGPLISAINRGERRRHRFAAELLTRLGREVIIPWGNGVPPPQQDSYLGFPSFPRRDPASGSSLATGR